MENRFTRELLGDLYKMKGSLVEFVPEAIVKGDEILAFAREHDKNQLNSGDWFYLQTKRHSSWLTVNFANVCPPKIQKSGILLIF